MKRAIREHWKDFAAIVGLLVITVVVAGYILNNERCSSRSSRPRPYTINADFQTAQAVTPGQGQSVRVSGVQIGLIGSVTLKNGEGVVQIDIDPQVQGTDPPELERAAPPADRPGRHVRRAQPGHRQRPRSRRPATRSRCRTRCRWSTWTRSWRRSTRTAASTSTCSSTAPARGCRTTAATSSPQVMERFEPTHRDLARLNGAVAQRGADLRQLVNSLRAAERWRSRPSRADRAAGRLERARCSARSPPRIRTSASAVAESAGHAQPDDRDARQGAGVRQGAGTGGGQPAAGREGDPGGQPGADRARRSRARRSSRTRSARSSSRRVRSCRTCARAVTRRPDTLRPATAR